jgi:hypothetical protein
MAQIERNTTAKDVDIYFNKGARDAAEGLVMLDKLIHRVASKDCDWDGLSRFIFRAAAIGTSAGVKKILRLAFGDNLNWSPSKSHATGGKITRKWKGDEGFVLGNGYGIITETIKNNVDAMARRKVPVGYNDKAFLKSLDDKLAPKVQKKREVTEKATAAAEKHVADYLIARMGEGFNIGEILDRVQATLAAAKVAQEAVKAAKVDPVH